MAIGLFIALPQAVAEGVNSWLGLGLGVTSPLFQVITGAVGFDDWEWGVTLFSRDPLEFKRIVTEMRYDEVSARYGEFGRFFTGIRLEDADWQDALAVE